MCCDGCFYLGGTTSYFINGKCFRYCDDCADALELNFVTDDEAYEAMES